MAILKCKMCGGNLEFTEGQSYGTCDSCGSTMTLPKANDERILNLFNRANHYRHQNEFDKALATYESILAEDNNNAEAHWGCVLSKYGIEYVEDPKTHKRVPTCHRVQNESVLSDLDYQNALKYAPDNHSVELYKSEAERISEIQKGILNIARNEEPYDIFICYKETDNNGRRTIDSTLAQDIYFQLVNEGYKVFFSRITLEDKLGTEYEPYIFAALNSAKVMLVVGTKAEYFNAVWVKNEWARFLDMSKKDKSKMIIPCYRDMDAYDLPDELSLFQSQDMSKIGFLQDLVRGITKVLQKQEAPAQTIINNVSETTQVEPLLKRAFLFLEEADWDKADELLEDVLNRDPENARAYLGKLMIDVKVNKEEGLGNRAVILSKYPNYSKAIRFADDELKEVLKNYCSMAENKLHTIEANRRKKEMMEEKERRDRMALDNRCRTKLANAKKEYRSHRRPFVLAWFLLAMIAVWLGYYVLTLSSDIGLMGFVIGFIGGLLNFLICWIIMGSKYAFPNTPAAFLTYEACDECIQRALDEIKPKVRKMGITGIVIGIIIIFLTCGPVFTIAKLQEQFSSIETYTDLLNNNATKDDVLDLTGSYGDLVYNTIHLSLYELDIDVDFEFDATHTLESVSVDVDTIFGDEPITLSDLTSKFGEYSYSDDSYMLPEYIFYKNGCEISIERYGDSEFGDTLHISK